MKFQSDQGMKTVFPLLGVCSISHTINQRGLLSFDSISKHHFWLLVLKKVVLSRNYGTARTQSMWRSRFLPCIGLMQLQSACFLYKLWSPFLCISVCKHPDYKLNCSCLCIYVYNSVNSITMLHIFQIWAFLYWEKNKKTQKTAVVF